MGAGFLTMAKRKTYYPPIKPPKPKSLEQQHAETKGGIMRLLSMLFFGLLRGK
jgi:hypothetical protein